MNEKLSRMQQQYIRVKCPQEEKPSIIDLIKDMSDSWEAYETKGLRKKISVRGELAWV